MKNIKERMISASGSVSGAASVLGSWQVCHSVCMGLIAMAGLLGITIVGMPLAFFTGIAIPVWTIALGILFVTYVLYYYKMPISRRLLMLNTGLIIAGVPFAQGPLVWIVGGGIGATGVGLFIKDKVRR